ncbi:MAG: hypothetical protein JRM99_08345 [Nitrososphaerota archaeon]|nr:hypothetical protein [Nitrososphaerota archaeon]
MANRGPGYECAICHAPAPGKTELMEHLRANHEILEVMSYAANTMILEQDRDVAASEYHRQFEHIKKELQGKI